jgi:hypothetical protein
LDHCEEVFGQLVVAGGDPAEVLQLGEEAFDEVPLAVEPRAEVRFPASIGLGRDVGERPLLTKSGTDAISIIGLVGQYDCSSGNVSEQIVSSLPIMALPSS